MSDGFDHPRVTAQGSDDESLREHGRQLAIDGLLQLALGADRSILGRRSAGVRWRRLGIWAAALAASLLLGTVAWRTMRPAAPVGPAPDLARQPGVPAPVKQPAIASPPELPPITLASGWRITPTGQTKYRVLAPGQVRLDRGELLVESVASAERKKKHPPLTIETPTGRATAVGTKFYVGTHPQEPVESLPSKGTVMPTSILTRVLVLAGVVTLVNAQGSVTGQAHHLLAAEAGKAPVNYAVTANGDFAVDLYRQLAKERPDKNLFFSPYSMSGALAMTAEGARGETAAQMGKVLRFPEAARHVGDDAQLIPWNTAMIHTGMADLLQRFNPKPASPELRRKLDAARKALDASKAEEKRLVAAQKWKEYQQQTAKSRKLAAELNEVLAKVSPYELRVANALWGEKSYDFQKPYVDTIHKFYSTGGLFPVDFKHNFDAERLKINAWVEGQTTGRIKDLLPEGALNELTRLILTNAIYFKGEWQECFEEGQTRPEDFTVAAGNKVPVPLMRKYSMEKARYGAFNADGSFFKTSKMTRSGQEYPDHGGFLAAELPYLGGDMSMVVLAPQDANGLPELEKKLSGVNLNAWFGKLEARKAHVLLPKFKLETEYQKMADTLKSLGMVRAFVDPTQPNGAQFDGMSVSTDPMKKLFIAGVFHKAFVDVSEKGTEAAAATAVHMAVARSAPRGPQPFTPTFRADRPFVFVIRDVKTGTILFLGRVVAPTQ